MIRPKLLTALNGNADIFIGEAEYVTAPGIYYFTVPQAVRRIHACCIGGGAQGAAENGSYQDDWDGGGGGGLGWANNIEVTPGEELVIQVGGTVGKNGTNVNNGNSWISRGFSNGSPEWVLVAGESPGNIFGYFRQGGTFTGDGGGDGGSGCSNSTYSEDGTNYVKNKGSGGGAGGYTGNGGSGSIYGGDTSGNGGAGSGGVSAVDDRPGSTKGARGGGTGIRGAGASGPSPRPTPVGFWGNANQAPGIAGSGGDKMDFGAGGAGERDGWDGSEKTQAGHGAVRIIWGNRFSYPDNADVEA